MLPGNLAYPDYAGVFQPAEAWVRGGNPSEIVTWRTGDPSIPGDADSRDGELRS